MEMAQIAKYVVTQPDPTFLDNTSLFDNAYAYFRIANAAAQIFEMQTGTQPSRHSVSLPTPSKSRRSPLTAALRYELGDHHSFEFIEGAVQCPMAPGLETLCRDVPIFSDKLQSSNLLSQPRTSVSLTMILLLRLVSAQP